jgi:hypothetical protein
MPFVLDPQVAGELGDETDLDTSVHPPIVHKLEYVLDYPGTDDLIQSFPVFLASEQLVKALTVAEIRGITWRESTITPGDFYDEYPASEPINYKWLVPGQSGDDCWTEGGELVVSDRMMAVLRNARIDDCGIERA